MIIQPSNSPPIQTQGTVSLGNKASFRVWAPLAEKLNVVRDPKGAFGENEGELFPLVKAEFGYFAGELDGFPPGTRYMFELHRGGEVMRRPDPASRLQAETVHGPSVVVDSGYGWTDGSWSGFDLSTAVLYELHVGTFTKEGTFDGVISKLDSLKDLGVTTIELLPVSQFPGNRNWGYDGVYPYAVQNSYGGPAGLRRLVDACHSKGLSVVLDVVYNHLGPEGNYLSNFGPYFTTRYNTPWGEALNFDGPHSDEVRRYFVENALYWFRDFHIDGLRLDAIHAIQDFSALHLLEELRIRTDALSRETGRPYRLIAESDLNDTRVIRSRQEYGLGMDAQWSDDFHHSVHALLTGERQGYYEDFGKVEDLGKAIRDGFVYDWRYSPYRKRHHGSPSAEMPADRFITYIQNHDQVGNRMLGERLSDLVNLEKLKLAAGLLFFSPGVPMLFMGEEYAETAPFQYFVSHGDPDLVEAVRRGRAEEFISFQWKGTPPDPQAKETFERCQLNHALKDREPHSGVLRFYQELIRHSTELRREGLLSKGSLELEPDAARKVLSLRYGDHLIIFNFHGQEQELPLPPCGGVWYKVLESSSLLWNGPGESFEQETRSDGGTLKIGPERFVYVIRKETPAIR